jgi:hypothetical protein
LSGREGFGVLSLPPAEQARRDSGVFVELKRLFSIAQGARTGGEVMGVLLAEKYSSNAGYDSVGR